MAKRKTKSESAPASKKTDVKQTAPKESTDKDGKSALKSQGSLTRFLGFFIPGVGFGGAFLLISALVMTILFWLVKTSFLSSGSEPWQIEYNLPEGVWAGEDVLAYVKKSNPDLFEKPFNDKRLLEDVSNSFNLSQIVKRVKSVQRRFPNTIVLDIEYFEPIAMVYVNSANGYYPVDKDGCLLPTGFFKETDIGNYLAIMGIKSLPMKPVGQSWSDISVETASQIAYELAPYKDEFGIVVIYVHESTTIDENYGYYPICFDIRLKNHTIIRWARYLFKATGVQLIDDSLSTEDKIAILRQRIKEKGEIKPDSPDEMFRFVPDSEPKSE